MDTLSVHIRRLVGSLLLGFGLGCASTPPPPHETEVRPPAPSADAEWVPGHWEWIGRDAGYRWVHGAWERGAVGELQEAKSTRKP